MGLALGLGLGLPFGGDTNGWVLLSGSTRANLDIDFVNGRAYNGSSVSIASLLTCTRASSGYYQNADGTLQSFGSNVLRYGSNGLLVEEARTNLFQRSQEFDNAAWTKTNTTITADTIAAPDGTTTADKLKQTAAGTVSYDVIQSITKAASPVAYTFSVYAKAAENTWLQYACFDGTDGNRFWFNLSTGAVGSTSVIGAGFTSTSYSMQPLANGWYRCIVSFTTKSAVGLESHIYCVSADAATSDTGVVGNGFYIWQADLQAGSFITSPIVTTSGSATRAADVVAFASIPSVITTIATAAGTLYSQFGPNTAATTGTYIFDFGNNRPVWYKTGAALLGYYDGTNLTGDFDVSGGISNLSRSWTGSTVTSSNNGASAATATWDGDWNIGTPTLGSQNSGTSSFINTYIRRLAAFNVALSGSALQTLTTPTLSQSSDPFILNGQIANLDIDFVNGIGYLNPGALTGYTNTATIASLLTCTRASTGYATTSAGALTSFAANTLRITDQGLLVEEARTNLILQSNAAVSPWQDASAGTTTVTANAAVAPDGTTTATKIVGNNANTWWFSSYALGHAAASTTCTQSVYLRADVPYTASLKFTFNGGVAYSQNVNITTTWQRFTFTQAFGGGDTQDLGVAINHGSGNTTYVWGWQHEAGASFATSYIPTTSGSATRAADNITFASQAWWNKTTGTYYGQATPGDVSSDTRIWGQNFNGTYLGASGNTFANWYDNTNSQIATAGSGGWTATAKAASAFDTGASSICMNNGTVVTSATVDFSSATTLYVGSNNAFNAFMNGYIKRMSYWNTKLSNAALGVLTT